MWRNFDLLEAQFLVFFGDSLRNQIWCSNYKQMNAQFYQSEMMNMNTILMNSLSSAQFSSALQLVCSLTPIFLGFIPVASVSPASILQTREDLAFFPNFLYDF